MESFPWWSEEQKRLATEMESSVERVMPRAEEAWWKREIAGDIYEKIAQMGYFGVAVPKAYGGWDWVPQEPPQQTSETPLPKVRGFPGTKWRKECEPRKFHSDCAP